MTIRSVPTNYYIRWIKASIAIGSKNYSLFLATSLLGILISLPISFIPYFGAICGSVLTFLIYFANLRFMRLFLSGAEVTFETYLNILFDSTIISQYQIYLIISALVPFTATGISVMGFMGVSSGLSILNILLINLLTWAAFLQLNSPGLSLEDALKKSFAGFFQNVIVVLLSGLLVALFAFGSIALCVVPFFLYFMPMMFANNYIVFTSIYEGLDVDKFTDEWNSKPKAETPSPVTPTTN